MRAVLPSDPGSDGGRVLPGVVVLGVAVFLALLWLILAGVPFLSEDWTQTAQLARVATLREALDPAREPLRPLQHAFLWLLAHSGLDPTGRLPAEARLVAFALHALSCAAVVALARTAGLSRSACATALVLFAVFPNVKALAWPAAIGSPGRVAFELVALLFLVRRTSTGGARDGWIALAALVVALGFHESAFLTPAIFLAWTACVGVERFGDGARRALRSLRDPFVLAACALCAAHVVHLLFFRPGRVHGAKDPAALPANVVKAALSLAPEAVRGLGVDGLRGHHGTIGMVAGGLAVALAGVAFALALRRGGIARFAALAVAIDLGLAVLGAGFVQRYAILASAFAALALARWADASRRAVGATVVVLGALWAYDAVVDAVEIRAAGRASLRLAAEARRVETPGRELAIVGVPDMAGAEEDVPWFNWGGALFLRAHGVTTPVVLLRERAFRTNSDQELVDSARLRALAESGVAVWRWSAPGALAPYPP